MPLPAETAGYVHGSQGRDASRSISRRDRDLTFVTPRALHLTHDGRLDDAAVLADPRLVRVMALLNRDGEETRVVGGAVRNALLGLPPGDIDLATTALPDAVLARAKSAKLRAIPTGIAHGTVTLLAGGLPLEVTTLREDIDTDGRHAVVRFGRDFARDADRRDFTVNALSAGLDGRLHDTTGGVTDLAAGRIRFIGDATTRIREDYLRILRFFRFHATYGVGPLDPEGLAAAVANRDGLDRLSRERVRAELMKLLAAPAAAAVLDTMDREGFLDHVLGGAADVPRMARLAAQAPDDADPLLRLSALAVRSPDDIDRLREALRLSNGERDRLLAGLTASASLDARPPDAARLRALLFEHGRAASSDGLRLARASDPDGDAGWDVAIAILRDCPMPRFPFTGEDVMARGLKGPAVGAALADLRRSFAAAGFPDDAGSRNRLLDRCLPTPPRDRE